MTRRRRSVVVAACLSALVTSLAPGSAAAVTPSGPVGSVAPTAATRATALRRTPPPYRGPAFVIGDSVLLGARSCMQARGWTVDARGSRQMSQAIALLSQRRARLPHLVAVHMGTNAGVSDEQVDALMRVLGPRRIVVLVTVQLPDDGRYAHEARTNLVLRSAAWRYPNVRIADWNARSETHLSTWTWADHIHLQPAGCRAFAAIVDGAGRTP